MTGAALIIVGSGGHAAVLADALLASGRELLGYTDADAARHGLLLCGRPVLGGDEVLGDDAVGKFELVNGIGGTGTAASQGRRQRVQQWFESRGWRFAGVRHPRAIVSAFATVHPNAQLLANAVVQAGATVERGCILNTGSVVEHNVALAEYVHVACHAVLCGDVQVGAGSHIGAGAVVRQGVRLGEGTVVGAAALVLQHSLDGQTLVGVPARPSRVKT